jgi:hypothetical protein
LPTIARPILSSLLVVSIALAVGCSSTPQIELPEPKDVPREQWSDAMLILDAMGITGQRDIPRQLAMSGATATGPAPGGSSAGNLASAAGSFASPPTGFSSGGALGLSLGLMLLGGGASPVQTYQTVAWVPAELVNSPQEASALVLKTMEDTRIKVFAHKRSALNVTVGKYVRASGRAYLTPADIYHGRPVQLDTAAMPAPAVTHQGQVYGPIFVHRDQYTIDANKNDIETLEAMTRMSKALPEWFYLYHPGQKLRKNSVPARILNKGESMYFVGK